VDGMANLGKLPSDAPLLVTSRRCCAHEAEGLNQKVRDPEQDPDGGPGADVTVTGVKAGPNPSGYIYGTW
jgi:hypothetical protein